MGLTRVKGGGIQPTILDPIQNLYTGSTVVFTVTVASKDTTHRYNGQGSSNGYKIDGKFAPFLVLTPGVTYKFDQADGSNSGHPLRFYKDAAKVTAYTTNVTTNGTAGSSGAYTQIVTGDATPTILYYQCSAHGYMGNAVQTNGLASSVPDDGSITTAKLADDAVTDAKLANSINSAIAANTAKSTNATHTGDVTGSTSLTIANDAVTGAKIADDAVDNEHIANNAVRTAQIIDNAINDTKIADGAVTASKLASGVQTTINNNADNKVITGSGTANTLNGEPYVHINSTSLSVGTQSPAYLANLHIRSAYASFRIDSDGANQDTHVKMRTGTGKNNYIYFGDADSENVGQIAYDHNGDHMKFLVAASERIRINSNGIQFGGSNGAAHGLDDYEEGTFTPAYSGTWTNISNSQLRHAMYTKIGNAVHIWMEYFITGNNGSYGNNAYIENLPFTGSSNPNSLYTPVTIAIMYGPGGYNLDDHAAGRSYISAHDDRLYLKMGTYSGVRHIWIQATYRTNY